MEGWCFVGSVSGEWRLSNIPRLIVLFHSCLNLTLGLAALSNLPD